MNVLTGSHPATCAVLLVVAISVAACAAVPPKGTAGMKLVSPLKPAAAMCLAEEDTEALRRLLGNDEMIRKAR